MTAQSSIFPHPPPKKNKNHLPFKKIGNFPTHPAVSPGVQQIRGTFAQHVEGGLAPRRPQTPQNNQKEAPARTEASPPRLAARASRRHMQIPKNPAPRAAFPSYPTSAPSRFCRLPVKPKKLFLFYYFFFFRCFRWFFLPAPSLPTTPPSSILFFRFHNGRRHPNA